jgi:apolipoprotein N-acyltransferase
VLLALAYPPFDIGQLAWLALVPLLFSTEGCRPGEAFRRGYVAGLTFFGLTLWWTIYTTEGGAPLSAALLGTVSLVAFLALYFGAAALWFAIVGTRLARTRSDVAADAVAGNLARTIACTAGWVTLEWMRGWFLFGGFGWNGLGVSQHRVVPLIQFSSVTGVYGVSALVCFVNVALYLACRRMARQARDPAIQCRLSWELYAATALVCSALAFGILEIQKRPPAQGTRTLRLALVQGNIPQTLKFDSKEKPMILERYRTLTERVMIMQPEMIIWPESATPEPLRYDPDSFALVTNLAERASAYLLTGTLDATPHSSPIEAFNAAMLVRPDGTLGAIYRKIHLVPFGEYVPLRRVFPFIKRLTPIEDSFERGREFTTFDLPEARFATVICFEDTVPGLYRRFVRRGVDFMVNLTNDAWFKKSPAAEMHLANAVFRAVESHCPLVRCTNNGVTCIVNEFGFVRTHLQPFTDGSVNCELVLPASHAITFYAEHGDIFVGVCAMFSGAMILWFAVSQRFSLKSDA